MTPKSPPPSPAAPLDLGPIRARLEAIANGVSADTLVTLDNGASWQPKGAQEFSEAIAHAPADIAALVAEVESLRDECKMWRDLDQRRIELARRDTNGSEE